MRHMTKSSWNAYASRAILGLTFILVLALYVMAMLSKNDAGQNSPSFLHAKVDEELIPEIKPDPKLILVQDTPTLENLFSEANYTLEKNDQGQVQVPHVYLAKLPKDFRVRDAGVSQNRQELFIQSLLPLILNVNYSIREERAYITKLHNIQSAGQSLSAEQRVWLDKIYVKYKMKERDIHMLLKRVDEIPVSLALAQGIQECGWGSSSAARHKNSTHGVTLASGVKSYDTLYESVYAYILNLNSNPAYASMRQIRHDLRNQGDHVCSEKLSVGLHKYSELGHAYTKKIRSIIRHYNLKQYDQARFQTL